MSQAREHTPVLSTRTPPRNRPTAVSELFARFAHVMGRSTDWSIRQPDGSHKANVGAWKLDKNFIYGGYRIDECHNDSYGEDTPFGLDRKGTREMESCLRFALDAIEQLNPELFSERMRTYYANRTTPKN